MFAFLVIFFNGGYNSWNDNYNVSTRHDTKQLKISEVINEF